MGFLDTLAAEMTAARRASSIAAATAPFMGGPAALPQTGGLLSRWLGISDAPPDTPAPGGALSTLLGGAAPAPAPASSILPGGALPFGPTEGPKVAAGGNSIGDIARLEAAGATPSTAPPGAPGNRPFSPMPAGPLPAFAASQGVPGSMSPNVQRALKFYQSQGLSPLAAAALVGGFQNESGHGLNTAALNRGDGSDGSNSIGVAQWNGDRARALHQFAASRGLNPGDLDTQLQFSWAELNGPEKATLAALQNAQNPGQATAAALGYERPAGWTAANPYGAKTFGGRLNSTVAMLGGGAVPALRGPQPSPFGGMAPAMPADTSGLPTMAASGMGMSLSPATRFAPAARGGAAYASGQPQRTDDQGNALDANGRPTALNYDAGSGMVMAPGQRAIAAGAPLDNDAPLPPAAQSYTRDPGTAPGTAAVAAGLAPSRMASASRPSPSVINGSQLDLGMIRSLVNNEDTQPFGLELWKAYLTKAPVNFERVETKNGDLYSFNPRTGEYVKRADGGVSPVVVNKSLVDPRSGRVVYDGNSPDTTTIAPADYATNGIPNGFQGLAQRGGDGKITLSPLNRGQADLATTAQQRQQLMQSQGRDLGDPAVQDYVATGKFQREGNLPATVLKAIADSDKGLDNLYHARDVLANLQGMNADTPGGMRVGAEPFVQRNAPGFMVPKGMADDAVNATEFDKTVQEQMLPRLKEYFGSRPAFAADQQMLKITPSTAMSPAERAPLLKGMAERVDGLIQQEEQKNTGLRSGSYYKPGGSPVNRTQSGAPAAAAPSAYTPAPSVQDAVTQARAAIAAGADPAAVKARLRQHGVNPADL